MPGIAGQPVTGRRRVGGGDINEAYVATLGDGTEVFVKTRADAAPGEYAAEAAGLAWLAEAGARTPRVIEATDTHLALDLLPEDRLTPEGEEDLGRMLATVHRTPTPGWGQILFSSTFEDRGCAETRSDPVGGWRVGRLFLPDVAAASWAEFYAEARIRPLARSTGIRAAEAVADRMAELVGPDEPPARLHGDLWSGNVLPSGGLAHLIDPAAYAGHREVDLAMLSLFGAPSPRTLAAYAEVAPLAEGHEDRVALYQLFPLLVHAELFGGSYVAAAERAARRYAG